MAHEWTETVTAVEVFEGAKIVTVKLVQCDKVCDPYMKVKVSSEGVFRIELLGDKVEPPDCWLKLPAERGTKWEHICENLYKNRYCLAKTESIQVPAGTFLATSLEVTCLMGKGFGQFTYMKWYAPGIGLVKESGQNSTLVMKSFTSGK